jgi:hypothetical protein
MGCDGVYWGHFGYCLPFFAKLSWVRPCVEGEALGKRSAQDSQREPEWGEGAKRLWITPLGGSDVSCPLGFKRD